jgi:hypothetical protein
MESKSIKDKIFYWGGLTLISSVIIGGSYYIYQTIFGSEEKDDNEEENENNSLNDSTQNIIQKSDNIEINSSNKTNNINSIIFSKNEESINSGETKETNTNNNNNSINKNIIIKEEQDLNELPEDKNSISTNDINIFNNDIIFLKSFGLNIDESKIFKAGTNKFEGEGAILIIIYINYLAEKFYSLDNPTLDEKRRSLLIKKTENNNDKLIEHEYLTMCNETLVYKRNIYQIAADKIFGVLKVRITLDDLNKLLSSIEPKQLEELSIKIIKEINSELHKYDLDYMDINKTKEAYIYYLKTYIDNVKSIYEQKENNENNENNENIEEQNAMIIFKFMSVKLQSDDLLYIKYKIIDEHLKLLVNKYNLLNDNEINKLQNEFDEINRKIDINDIKI